MTAEVIVLADRRPVPPQSALARDELQRLKSYARRYIDAGNLQAFADGELEDLERLIAKHSMVIELLDQNGNISEQQIVFID